MKEMNNKEDEKTLCIDMDRVAEEAGLDGNDKWINFDQDSVDKCIGIIDSKIGDFQPDIIQLTGRFPIEISLQLGAYFAGAVRRLEFFRPEVSRRVIFTRPYTRKTTIGSGEQ